MDKKEYIERGAILRKAEPMFDGQKYCTAVNTGFIYIAPAADVVEVVRCKECEYYEDGVCNAHSEYEDKYTRGHLVTMDGDDFCSIGVRKNEKTYTLAEVKAELGLDQMDGGRKEE